MNLICETSVPCPYCGESFPIAVDTSQGDYSTIEDCSICCRPIALEIQCEPGEVISIEVAPG